MNHPERVPLIAARLARDPRLAGRLAHFYERLCALPRAQRRAFGRRTRMTMAAAALLLALSSTPARGASIEVLDGEVFVTANGRCSLIEAIHNANDTTTGQPYADCAAGDPAGFDELVLPAQSVFTLTAADNTTYGRSGLPVITSPMSIGSETRAYIDRDPAAEPFRILAVGRDGQLSLGSLTITGGQAAAEPAKAVEVTYAASGGGVVNLGLLFLNNTVISGNTAAVGGGIYNAGELDGFVHLIANVAANEGDALLSFGDADLHDSDIRENGGPLSTTAIVNEGDMALTSSYVRDNDSTASLRNRGRLEAYGVVFENGGVGLDNAGGAATIRQTTITGHDNAVVNAATALIDRSALIDNGRGILNLGGELTLVNSTISGNLTDGNGGGIAAYGGYIRGLFNTITDNEADKGGGLFAAGHFVYGYLCRAGAIDLKHSIVTGNRAVSGPEGYREPDVFHCFSFLDLDESIVGHDGQAGLVNVEPLPDNIVPDEPAAAILVPEWTTSAAWIPHHILPWGSPAIDVLPDVACEAPPVNGIDQIGQERNQDGDYQPSERECDLGAIERQLLPYRSFAPFAVRAD